MRARLAELPIPLVDPTEVRDRAAEILDGSAYRDPSPSLLDRFLDAVGDLLGRVLATLTGGGPGTVIGTFVVTALALGAGVALARAARAVGGPIRRAGDHRPLVGTSAPVDPATWLAAAVEAAAGGDWRGALRCRHQALLAELVGIGLVPPSIGRTAREVAAEVARVRPDLASGLIGPTDRFERAWYGPAPVIAADVDRHAAEVDTVLGRLRAQPVEVGS